MPPCSAVREPERRTRQGHCDTARIAKNKRNGELVMLRSGEWRAVSSQPHRNRSTKGGTSNPVASAVPLPQLNPGWWSPALALEKLMAHLSKGDEEEEKLQHI